jgi:hypothetical protein
MGARVQYVQRLIRDVHYLIRSLLLARQMFHSNHEVLVCASIHTRPQTHANYHRYQTYPNSLAMEVRMPSCSVIAVSSARVSSISTSSSDRSPLR